MTAGWHGACVRGPEACGKVVCELHGDGGVVEEGDGGLLQLGDEAGI